MDSNNVFRLAADIVLILHVAFVLFVISSLLLIFIGRFRGWHWVRNFWFRIAHLAAIGLVVMQSWLGVICPLTVVEMGLRARAGEATYRGAFIAHWLESLLYYEAPAWVFALAYTVSGALVVACWFWVRPRWPNVNRRQDNLPR
jgi:hypothetical protein